MSDHDLLLRQTIARHFPAAEIRDRVVHLGVDDLAIECWVNGIHPNSSITSASLYFVLRTAVLGMQPVFASISGYGTTPEEAIVTGGCNWACAFGPVLRAGLSDEAVPDVPTFVVEINGQTFDVFVDCLDRTMAYAPNIDFAALGKAARARFSPEGWLTRTILESGVLPVLSDSRPTVLSVFASDTPGKRLVELKIDGADWPHASAVFADVAFEQQPVATLMRELAVVVPASPAPRLTFDAVAHTVDGIGAPTVQHDAALWPGWKHHRGELGPRIAEETMVAIESHYGELPADYRAFLIDVAGWGAGPGYGLFSPVAKNQIRLAAGDFSWEHETAPASPPRGVLALAHAGCGVMWLIVLDGPHRGEVWLDARSSNGKVRRVAPSFDAWYRGWLVTAVRNSRFVQWDPDYCAAPNVFAQVIEKRGLASADLAKEMPKLLKAGSVSLAPAGETYVPKGSRLNPCHGCITIAQTMGLGPEVFAAGAEPVLQPAISRREPSASA